MRYSLEKGLERDHHCGIFVGDNRDEDDDCDYNEIRDNDIHNNNGEGIYLEYADYTLIIDNEIYLNELHGIYFENSNDCEIYCNDIYQNDIENLTGIYLDSNSEGNVVNYNSATIVENLESVLIRRIVSPTPCNRTA